VFFSGDTGFCPVFSTIGKRYGPFDLGLIAIGAYCPREVMQPQHIDPIEAVQIHQDLKCKFSVGIHWGTFILTDEPEGEPPILLAQELKKRGLHPTEFVVTKIGETFATISKHNPDSIPVTTTTSTKSETDSKKGDLVLETV